MTAQSTSMFRLAGPEDAADMEAFLSRHEATSMFLRANLASYGTSDRHAPYATTFFVGHKGRTITAVFGITNGGYVMAQAPNAAQALWEAFAKRIAGRSVCGITGVPAQVEACLFALGIADAPLQMHLDEPLYHLNLADLDCEPVTVRAAVADDLPLLEAWFNTYAQDIGHAPPGTAITEAARDRAAGAIASPDVVLLLENDVPVAMAGINARLPNIVQIGGVYTPAALRGRGYARKALAGLLRNCAASGVTQSVLSANNAPAARAYQALGYRKIGTYRVALLQTPTVIGESP